MYEEVCVGVMKSIYTYYDYRRYISDFYLEKKSLNPNYSYRYIAGKVGFDHALIVKILRGERHIGDKKVEAFASLLGLSDRQKAYFRLLVSFGKAKNGDERKRYFEQVLAYSDIPEKRIDSGQYEFYQRWYYTVVREILNIRPFKDDYHWLAEAVQPKITAMQAKKAVRLLDRLGMIARGADGYYSLTDKFVTTGENWQSIAIRSFQKESCSLAARAIDSVIPGERDISTVTVSLSKEGFDRIRKSLARFRREIVEVSSSCETVDRAYQMNLQFFPVSGNIAGDKERES
jgi:uncharacterized protein (TIGR02147 family)